MVLTPFSMLSYDPQITFTLRITQRLVESDSAFGFLHAPIGNDHNTFTAFTFKFQVFALNFCNEMATLTPCFI